MCMYICVESTLKYKRGAFWWLYQILILVYKQGDSKVV